MKPRQRTGALCMQHSPTAEALSISFLLNYALQKSQAKRIDYKIQGVSHTAALVWDVSQKDWRNQAATGWILATL